MTIRTRTLVLLALWAAAFALGCRTSDSEQAQTGWAIGYFPDGRAAIVHTGDGGRTWVQQANSTLPSGMSGNDISAVNKNTAWAALGSGRQGEPGAIAHTADGGRTWTLQELPGQIGSTVKAVKGVSALEAWAATLDGTVLHTLDGGTTWDIIPHDGVPITQVNRMDVLGNDIWIADYMGGEYGMVHSADSGRTWRRERLPGLDLIPGGGPMAVSIVSKRTAWASVRPKADIYRTVDGGHSWQLDAPDVSGPNDLDDICAFNATCAWAVQNISGQNGGRIIRVELRAGQVQTRVADPMNGTYQYEGVTCLDDGTVWVVGFKSAFADPDLPQGVILQSTDGHQWIAHDPPCRTASLWKISFAGARR